MPPTVRPRLAYHASPPNLEREVRAGTLSRCERQLLDVAAHMGEGSIVNIAVTNGTFVIRPEQVGRRYQLDRDERRCERAPFRDDTKLSGRHLRLLTRLRAIRSGVVTIIVREGLPYSIDVYGVPLV
jgi:hypothetical protein